MRRRVDGAGRHRHVRKRGLHNSDARNAPKHLESQRANRRTLKRTAPLRFVPIDRMHAAAPARSDARCLAKRLGRVQWDRRPLWALRGRHARRTCTTARHDGCGGYRCKRVRPVRAPRACGAPRARQFSAKTSNFFVLIDDNGSQPLNLCPESLDEVQFLRVLGCAHPPPRQEVFVKDLVDHSLHHWRRVREPRHKRHEDAVVPPLDKRDIAQVEHGVCLEVMALEEERRAVVGVRYHRVVGASDERVLHHLDQPAADAVPPELRPHTQQRNLQHPSRVWLRVQDLLHGQRPEQPRLDADLRRSRATVALW
eukprot:Opistho-1_new@64020